MLIKTGIVVKKKGFKSKKVRLTLTNQPRLFVQNENGRYKYDFLISKDLKVMFKSRGLFEVICDASKTVVGFRVDPGTEESKSWTSKINRVIEVHTRAA